MSEITYVQFFTNYQHLKKDTMISWLVKEKNASNEDMILALAGQFKQLSHEPEKFR